jgi:YidC/Oxa1 family membrane protein insertase
MVRMQSRMGDLAPKLEELKKKHANDKTRLQQETMRLYREEGINPAGQLFTCLPMAIQMPIWVALWISLSSNIAMRLQPFFWWIDDLTAPDALYTFASPLNLPLVGQLPAFNLLPFLLAIAMYFQQKLMPKPKPNPNATEQQIQQQQMMQKMGPLMAVMMLFIFYKAPSGLTLYIMFSTIFGAYEQHRIRKHIKDREEAGTLHKKAKDKPGMPKRPPGPLARMLNRLQSAADDAQKSSPRSRR